MGSWECEQRDTRALLLSMLRVRWGWVRLERGERAGRGKAIGYRPYQGYCWPSGAFIVTLGFLCTRH